MQGEDYDFIFDTGALTVIAVDVAEQLSVKPLLKYTITDALQEKRSLLLSQISHLTVGGVAFQHVGTAIADFDLSQKIKCAKFAGILGANVLRNAVWQINYRQSEIILTSHFDSVEVPSTARIIDFYESEVGIPVIGITLNGVREPNMYVDTGFSGTIAGTWDALEEIREQHSSVNVLKGVGSNDGLHGVQPTKSYLAKITKVQFEHFLYEPSVIRFYKRDFGVVGNGFLRNFTITLDWAQDKVFMEEICPVQLEPF